MRAQSMKLVFLLIFYEIKNLKITLVLFNDKTYAVS